VAVRPAPDAAVRVTVVSQDLVHDLRWYDDAASIVPLWWLGIWLRGTDQLVHTSILQGPRTLSPLALFTWLSETAPAAVAVHLVGTAAEAVAATRPLAS